MKLLTQWLVLGLLPTLFAPPLGAQPAGGAVTVLTYIDLQPKLVAQGVRLLKSYRLASRKEPGEVAIALVVETGRPNRFLIAEMWRDRDAFTAHDKGDASADFRAKLQAVAQSPPDRRAHHDFATAPGKRGGAVFVATHVDVTPPKQKETEGLLQRLAEDSRKEDGNVVFDVFQQDGRANHFGVWAAWRSQQALDRHQNAAHTMQFRAGVAPLLGALYDERLYRPID